MSSTEDGGGWGLSPLVAFEEVCNELAGDDGDDRDDGDYGDVNSAEGGVVEGALRSSEAVTSARTAGTMLSDG